MEFVLLIHSLTLDASYIELLIPALPRNMPLSVLKSPPAK
jgi:hypothetical protein